MKRFFVPFIFFAMLSGCATYEAGNPYPAPAAQGIPVDPTYPGPGAHIGIGVGKWGGRGGGGVGVGLGW